MTLDVLIATINQDNPADLLRKMNVKNGAVVANQCNKNSIEINSTDNVRFINTTTRGVGLNRNIALAAANSDIILFADDDIVYREDYRERILQSFREFPEADLIAYGIEFTKNNKVFDTRNVENRKLHLFSAMKFGAAVIAVRRNSLIKKGICFNQLFGGGSLYSFGEDSLFIIQCLRSGLKAFSYNYTLGSTSKDKSTWFKGFDKKYFYDRGAWIASAFPHISWLAHLYYTVRFFKETELSLIEIYKEIGNGKKGFRSLTGYEE